MPPLMVQWIGALVTAVLFLLIVLYRQKPEAVPTPHWQLGRDHGFVGREHAPPEGSTPEEAEDYTKGYVSGVYESRPLPPPMV